MSKINPAQINNYFSLISGKTPFISLTYTLTNFILFLFCLFSTANGFAQNQSKKREFRGVWVASVANIDWPSAKNLSSETQQKEFIEILDNLTASKMNAIVVQIRPAADAFFPSKLEPWSYWLTGAQGKAPDPYYDPLKFMIEECHKRNLEFHAWINPFRVATPAHYKFAENHISQKKPEWIVEYGSLKMLNPGLPEVRAYLLDVIAEILTKYKVDALHFDDYFYPYPERGIIFKDEEAFKENNPNQLVKGDWRRENINTLIRETHQLITQINPRIKFGIGPSGIWRNKRNHPDGSDTNGLSAYDELFADTKKWINEGWIDYIAPQLYWTKNYKPASYDKLVKWWSENIGDKHLYVGHAVFNIHYGNGKQWKKNGEIPGQIRYNRQFDHVHGSLFFSASHLQKNPGYFTDSLRQNLFTTTALLPTMSWKDSIPPRSPKNFQVQQGKDGNLIRWESASTASDGDNAYQYLVYKFPDSLNFDEVDGQFIQEILPGDKKEFFDKTEMPTKSFKYAITALDSLQNESDLPFQMKETSAVSEITNIAIFPGMAQVDRATHVLVDKGFNRIYIPELSPKLIPESLVVTTSADVKVSEIRHHIAFNDLEKYNSLISQLYDSINAIQFKLKAITDSMEVLQLTEKVMMANQKLEGTNYTVSTEEVRKFTAFFQEKLNEFRNKQRLLTQEEEIQAKILNEVRRKVKEYENWAGKESGKIELIVESKEKLTIPIEISFLVKNTDWKPIYNFKIDKTKNDVWLGYQAKISQRTEKDWEQVNIGLFSKQNNWNGNLKDSVSTDFKNNFDPIVNIKLPNPVSIPSDSIAHLIHVIDQKIKADFIYQIIAEKSNYSFLKLELPEWRKLNLSSGKAKIFVDNLFYANSYLETNNSLDTLPFIVGKDKTVIVEKSVHSEKIEKPHFVFFKKDIRHFKITIKNLKEKEVTVELKETIPYRDKKWHHTKIFTESEYTEKENGNLEWEFELKPGESKIIEYGYKYSYPKPKQKSKEE
ncbi:family 10 glycosylhydrolase [Flexithrix dorotheae]|uniref:family 10 glycosylhydrolase n=1 Tax=Flexithrix dorotheae TaxID=70993 RepID=UPI00037DA374|nr:family 10 glycosylhydrolase [Flexithrix dorotheae]